MNTSKNFLSPTITPKMVGRSLQTSRISMFALAAFSLLLLPTALISETRVTWSAIDRGIATDVGTPLSPGSLVRLGSFDLTPAQIVSNASDITYLNQNFTEFSSAVIGEGVNDLPGLWYQDTLQSSTAALQLENEPIYIWAFDGPNIASSVEHGIFSVLDYRWIFPSDTDLPNLTAIDLFQADTADILVGNEGKGTYQGQPLYNLALIDGLATRDLDIVGSGIFNTPILAGTVSNRIITLENNGNAEIEITGMTVPAGFSMDWTQGIIPPFSNQEVTLTFHPSSSGTYGSTLQISSNQMTGPNSFAVSGTAETTTPENLMIISGLSSSSPGGYPLAFLEENMGGLFHGTIDPDTGLYTFTHTNSSQSSGWEFVGLEEILNDGQFFALWFNASTVSLGFWPLDSEGNNLGWQVFNTGGSGYNYVGAFDMNDNGVKDFILHNPSTGTVGYWIVDPVTLSSAGFSVIGTGGLDWRPFAVADITGDGKPEILWEKPAPPADPDLPTWLWLVDFDGSFVGQNTGDADNSWERFAVMDLNGNGKDEILWYYEPTRTFGAWRYDTVLGEMVYEAIGSAASTDWIPAGVIKAAPSPQDPVSTYIVWLNQVTGELGMWIINSDYSRTWTGILTDLEVLFGL